MIRRSDILNMCVGDKIEASEEVDIVRVKEGWLYGLSNGDNGNYDVVMVPYSPDIAKGNISGFVECHEDVDVIIVPGGKIYGMWYAVFDPLRANFVDMVKRLGGSMNGNRAQGKLFSQIVNYMQHSEAENVRRHVFVSVPKKG